MARKASPSPRSTSPSWQPDYHLVTRLFHGCLRKHATSMISSAISHSVGHPDTDFGLGFYMTTLDNLPVEQVHEFWTRVEWELTERHHLHGEQSVRGILQYRNEIDRVGPIIYHREPADVADDIISGEYIRADRKVG